MIGGSLLIMIHFLIQRTNDWGIFADNDWGIFADNDSLSDIRYRGQMTEGSLLIMIHFLIQRTNDWDLC